MKYYYKRINLLCLEAKLNMCVCIEELLDFLRPYYSTCKKSDIQIIMYLVSNIVKEM